MFLLLVRHNSATGTLIEFRQFSLFPQLFQTSSSSSFSSEFSSTCVCVCVWPCENLFHTSTPSSGTVVGPRVLARCCCCCPGCKIQSNSFSILFDLTRELGELYRSFFLLFSSLPSGLFFSCTSPFGIVLSAALRSTSSSLYKRMAAPQGRSQSYLVRVI